MGVASIVMGVAVPDLLDVASQSQLGGITHQLAFDVGCARMKAVAENGFCRIQFQSRPSSYWIETSTDGTTYTTDGVATSLPSEVTFASVPDAPPLPSIVRDSARTTRPFRW